MGNLICPVSFETINKRASRVGATTTALLLVAYVLTGAWVILVAVVADYTVRVLTSRRSPIGVGAGWALGVVGVKPKMMDKAPKIFAWRVGYLMALVSLALLPVNPAASLVVAAALAGFNVLDGVVNVCVGCVVYTYIVLPYLGQAEAQAQG